MHAEGRVQEAMTHYLDALELDPRRVTALFNLANALQRAGRLSEAIGYYKEVLRLEPDFTKAQEAIADLQHKEHGL